VTTPCHKRDTPAQRAPHTLRVRGPHRPLIPVGARRLRVRPPPSRLRVYAPPPCRRSLSATAASRTLAAPGWVGGFPPRRRGTRRPSSLLRCTPARHLPAAPRPTPPRAATSLRAASLTRRYALRAVFVAGTFSESIGSRFPLSRSESSLRATKHHAGHGACAAMTTPPALAPLCAGRRPSHYCLRACAVGGATGHARQVYILHCVHESGNG